MMLILYVSQADRRLCIGRCVLVGKKYPRVQVRWKESNVILNVTAPRTGLTYVGAPVDTLKTIVQLSEKGQDS